MFLTIVGLLVDLIIGLAILAVGIEDALYPETDLDFKIGLGVTALGMVFLATHILPALVFLYNVLIGV